MVYWLAKNLTLSSSLLNGALLGIWAWRFAIGRDNAAWKLCIKAKYGIEAGGWFTKQIRGASVQPLENHKEGKLLKEKLFQRNCQILMLVIDKFTLNLFSHATTSCRTLTL